MMPGGLVIREGPVAPNWPTGIALGIGGIAGGYLSARMQSRLPDTLISRTVGILAIAIAAQFLRSGLALTPPYPKTATEDRRSLR